MDVDGERVLEVVGRAWQGAVTRPDTLLSLVLCAAVAAFLLARWVPELLRPDPSKSVSATPPTVVWEAVRPIGGSVCVAVQLPDGWALGESAVEKATVHRWSATATCAVRGSQVASAGSAVQRLAVPAGAGEPPRRGYQVSVANARPGGRAIDLTLDPALEFGESQMLAFVGNIGSVARPHDVLLVAVADLAGGAGR